MGDLDLSNWHWLILSSLIFITTVPGCAGIQFPLLPGTILYRQFSHLPVPDQQLIAKPVYLLYFRHGYSFIHPTTSGRAY
ncbi:MAG: hypothetical protein ABI416_01800 [Ginsengibacter sp.]